MAELNDLLIRIDATTEQMRRELKTATGAVDSSTRRMDQHLTRVDGAFGRLGKAASMARGALAAVFGAAMVRSATRFVSSQIDAADAIQKASQTAAVGAERLQELRFAFGQLAGVTTRDVDLGLQRFNRRLGLAQQGSKEYADALRQIGVAVNQDTGPALEATLGQIARIENDAERSALASKLFGEEFGPRLAGALSQGIEAVDKLAKQLRADGGVLTQQQVDKAAEFNDQMDRLGKLLSAESQKVILDNAQAFETMATWLGVAAANAVKLMAALPTGFGAPRSRGTGRENDDPILDPTAGAADVPTDVTGGGRRVLAPVLSPTATYSTRSIYDMGVPQSPDRDSLSGWREINALFEEGARVTEQARTPLEQYNDEVERLVELNRVGAITDETYNRAVQQAGEDLGSALRTVEPIVEQIQEGVTDSLVDGITEGADGIRRVWDTLLRDMVESFIRSGVKDLVASLGTGGSGGVSGFFSSIFGGARANGGPVQPGMVYAVGERGPELFAPRVPGTIIPNGGAMGGVAVQVIDQRGAGAPPVEVSESRNGGQRVIRAVIRGEVAGMFADGSIDAMFAGAGMPVRRRGIG